MSAFIQPENSYFFHVGFQVEFYSGCFDNPWFFSVIQHIKTIGNHSGIFHLGGDYHPHFFRFPNGFIVEGYQGKSG